MANPTYDQRRAKHAWALVSAMTSKDEITQREFKIHAKRMALRILSSGLGQALSYLDIRELAHDLRNGMADWIAASGLADVPQDESDDLLDWIMWGDTAFLRFATRESLAYLEWVSRFSDALIEISETD